MSSTSLKTFSRLRAQHILYADRGLIAINKPPGLVCQSDKTFQERKGRLNAFDSLLGYLKRKLDLSEEPVQVHRLDKSTTGVLLLAKSKTQARTIFQQFQSHSIKKTYLAIVRGGSKSFPAARGSINTPLKVGYDRVYVDEKDGATALTDWELLGSSDKAPLSLLRLSLHSGIKHQLRVHLASILKVPILGDTMYSKKPPAHEILEAIPAGISVMPKKWSAAQDQPDEAYSEEQRIFLHAAHVDVTRYKATGPSKRLLLGITAPLPDDFVKLCNATGLTTYLPSDYITGGLTIDHTPVSQDEEIAGIEGRWFNQ